MWLKMFIHASKYARIVHHHVLLSPMTAAQFFFFMGGSSDPEPESSAIWYPGKDLLPKDVGSTPSYLLLAADLLKEGKLLNELHWREFEKLIGELLETDGWKVSVTQAAKDGGVDVIADRNDETLGPIRSLWQAKKYGPTNKVKLKEVRELSGVLACESATKGVMVTTSHLTKDAVEWIKRHRFKLDYREQERLEEWVLRNA